MEFSSSISFRRNLFGAKIKKKKNQKKGHMSNTSSDRNGVTLIDTGGRTVQVLPKEAQITWQDWRTKNYNLQRVNVIISLPYVG